jgi:hypothetical protein
MNIKSLRPRRMALVCLGALVALVLPAPACDPSAKHPSASIAGSDALLDARRRLEAAPFTELVFVPADAEAVLRVDLAALARRDEQAAQMLDFLLQAQQPQAWKLLNDAGVRAGKELRAVYLVVGPRAGASPAQATLVAGVGDIDSAKARAAFGTGGGMAEVAPGNAAIYVWPHARVALGMGATIPMERKPRDPQTEDELLQESAIGVADGLLLFGSPPLVRRALAVRAGEGKDVRQGALALELAQLEGGASAWGVARQDAEGVVRTLAPGLRVGRFHLGFDAAGSSELRLRAEFGAEAEARAFASQLEAMIGAAALMTRKTPIGESLSHMKETSPVTVQGTIVQVGAKL